MKNTSFFQKAIINILQSLPRGRLTLTLPDGEQLEFGDGEQLSAAMTVYDDKFFKHTLLHGEIGFGESYVNRWWDSDDPTAVVAWLLLNRDYLPGEKAGNGKGVLWNSLHLINRLKHFLRRNTRIGSRRNIEAHYDLGNDFYRLFLDQSMTYSSAYYTDKWMSLQEAQEEKYRQICEKINLRASDHILEVGCGWGGFSIYAATHYQCRITAVTISPSQYRLASERIRKLGLRNLIDLRLCDYRDLKGQYDKVVSIEMIEAVGHEFLAGYFRKLQELTTEDGVIAIQAITIPDSRYEDYRKSSDWIRKHIFPGGHLPSVGMINRFVNAEGDMHLLHLESFGLHYARTLSEWRDNLKNRENEAVGQGNNSGFLRKWYFYFHLCEAAFSMRNVNVVQLVLGRANNLNFLNPPENNRQPISQTTVDIPRWQPAGKKPSIGKSGRPTPAKQHQQLVQ